MPYITRGIAAIDALNAGIGCAAKWLVPTMVLVQFAIVILRYVFGIGSVQMQEAVLYMHGTLFLIAAADTLRADAHVRVDIFYANHTPRARALTDLLGASFLLLPFCILILYASWDYVALSWSVREGSRETSGIHAVYLLKSVILLFAVQLALQALASIGRNALIVWER